MSASTLFTDAMRLVPRADPGADTEVTAFDGELNEHWTIASKPHGGAMLALCANAARTTHGGDGVEPVAVSGSFLSAPEPGGMRLTVSMRKRGRRISVADVELSQGGRTAVHAVVTLAAPEHQAAPVLSAETVAASMPPEPPPHVAPIGPGHPLAGIVALARGCDIRPVVETQRPRGDGDPPVFEMWVRPKGVAPDVLFALLAGDVSAPVTLAVDRGGWAPTVHLTAYLRAVPADGWLRVTCSTVQIGHDWFDEDHTVVDSTGRLVMQTRQLAMVPGR